jgi:hypothetical protein
MIRGLLEFMRGGGAVIDKAELIWNERADLVFDG